MEKQPILTILTLLTMLLATSCGEKVKKSTVMLSNLNMAGGNIFTGGSVLWAKKLDGTVETFSLPFNSSNDNVEISLTKGKWKFYFVGWLGASNLEGATKCAITTQELISNNEVVNISVNASNCSFSDFGLANQTDSNQFKSLSITTCNDLTGTLAGSNCDSGTIGNSLSYQVFLPNITNDAPPLGAGLYSTCKVANSAPSSQTDLGLRLPIGSLGTDPLAVVVRSFLTSNCSGGFREYNFNKGLGFDRIDAKTFSGAIVTNELYIETIAPIISNDITISNLILSNNSPTGFDASIDFINDANDDSIATLYYCNDTDSIGCNPLAGSSQVMAKVAATYAVSITGLTAPNDTGDTLSVKVLVTDPDGIAGSPQDAQVTLSDTSPPLITNVNSSTANGSYKVGDQINIDILFNEVVNVTGTPQLTLETGAVDQVANYLSGTGTSTLLFQYTILAGDISTNLDYKATTSLNLNGGTIQDASANAANLTLATPGASLSLGFNTAFIIDTTNPLAPTSLVWTQPSPYNAASINSSWTLSPSGDIASQNIQYYSDATCTVTDGAFIALSNIATTHNRTGNNGITYSYKVDAIDNAGNTTTSPCSSSLEIDTTFPGAPTALVWTQPSPYNAASINSSWTLSPSPDIASQNIQYYSDATCTSADGSSIALSNIATTHNKAGNNGITYYYNIDVVDNAGNTTTSPCSTALEIDTTFPGAPTALVWTQASPYNAASINSSWTLSPSPDIAIQKIQYYSDATCTSVEGASITLTNAANTHNRTGNDATTYSYKIDVIDNAGNMTTSPCSSSLEIDTTFPSSVALDVADNFIYQATFNVTFSAGTDTNFEQYHFTIDGSIPNCSSPAGASATIPVQVDGFQVNLRVISCDTAGNSSPEQNVFYNSFNPIVQPFYTNGINWNDYVADLSDPNSIACSGSGPCFHAGHLRKVTVTNVSTCGSLTLTDDLNIFDWVCNDISGTAIFQSKKFQPGVGLKDLLLNTPAWKNLQVTLNGPATQVENGGAGGISNATSNTIWGNTVTALPINPAATTTLNTASNIYVYETNNDIAGYEIAAAKIAIVNLNGSLLTKSTSFTTNNCNHASGGSGSIDSKCLIFSLNQKYLWIESSLNGKDTNTNKVEHIIDLHGIKYSQIKNSHLNLATNSGLFLKNSSDNFLSGIKATNINGGASVGDGIRLEASSNNKLININLENNSETGISLRTASDNNFIYNLKAAHNGDLGMWVNASHKNKMYHMQFFGNTDATGGFGMAAQLLAANDNTMIDVTMTSNDVGLNLDNSHNNILMDFTIANNLEEGLLLDSGSSQNSLFGISSVHNTAHGIHLSYVTDNELRDIYVSSNDYNIQIDYATPINNFSGILKAGNFGTNRCYTDANTSLTDSTCVVRNGSTAILTATPLLVLAEFMVTGASNSLFSTLFDDWLSGVNDYFSWGKDITSFPMTANIGACTTGNCYDWDWRVKSSSSHILNQRAVSTGSDTFSHTWSDASTHIFLLNARELLPLDELDLIYTNGNHNLLCESNESCISSRNISSYQGDLGSKVKDNPKDITTGGTISNVEMWKYNTNGVP